MDPRKQDKNNQKINQPTKEEKIGLDPDEQAMNGEYGMAETEEEDRANDRDGLH